MLHFGFEGFQFVLDGLLAAGALLLGAGVGGKVAHVAEGGDEVAFYVKGQSLARLPHEVAGGGVVARLLGDLTEGVAGGGDEFVVVSPAGQALTGAEDEGGAAGVALPQEGVAEVEQDEGALLSVAVEEAGGEGEVFDRGVALRDVERGAAMEEQGGAARLALPEPALRGLLQQGERLGGVAAEERGRLLGQAARIIGRRWELCRLLVAIKRLVHRSRLRSFSIS